MSAVGGNARLVGLLVGCSFVSAVWGNDSISRIGAGGLELVKTDAIQMQKEVLEISVETVTVEYYFFNKTENDIKTLVAFPMPVYGWNADQSAADTHIRPIADFKVWSNGQSVQAESHYKALLNNRDIAKELERIGLSREQIYITFAGCVLDGEFSCAVSPQQIAKLKKIGAYTEEPFLSPIKYSLGPSWNMWKYGAVWDVEQTLVWTQLFPARKLTHIAHAYTPLVGSIFSVPLNESALDAKIAIQAAAVAQDKGTSESCIDESFKRAYAKKMDDLQKAGAKTIIVSLEDVEYVLGTGKNWSGPIQDFTLRIKKANKDQLVSLCFPGTPKRIDPLTIEFHHQDFMPQDRLVVYFYSFRTE